MYFKNVARLEIDIQERIIYYVFIEYISADSSCEKVYTNNTM